MWGPPYRGGDVDAWRAEVERISPPRDLATLPPLQAPRNEEDPLTLVARALPDNPGAPLLNGVPGARSFATMRQLRHGITVSMSNLQTLFQDSMQPHPFRGYDLMHDLCQDLANDFWREQQRLRRQFGISKPRNRGGLYNLLGPNSGHEHYHPYFGISSIGDTGLQGYHGAIQNLMNTIRLPTRVVQVGEGLRGGHRAAPHWAGPRLTENPAYNPRPLNVSLKLERNCITSIARDGAIELCVEGIFFWDDFPNVE